VIRALPRGLAPFVRDEPELTLEFRNCHHRRRLLETDPEESGQICPLTQPGAGLPHVQSCSRSTRWSSKSFCRGVSNDCPVELSRSAERQSGLPGGPPLARAKSLPLCSLLHHAAIPASAAIPLSRTTDANPSARLRGSGNIHGIRGRRPGLGIYGDGQAKVSPSQWILAFRRPHSLPSSNHRHSIILFMLSAADGENASSANARYVRRVGPHLNTPPLKPDIQPPPCPMAT